MEYGYTLTANQQSKMFLFGYFNRPVFWVQRRFAGPILIVVGFVYLIIDYSINALILSALFVIFGIYYIIRPYLFRRRIKLTDSSGKIIIDENGISIINELGTLNVIKENILKVLIKGNYIFIKTFINTKQYYILDIESITNDADKIFNELSSLSKIVLHDK